MLMAGFDGVEEDEAGEDVEEAALWLEFGHLFA
jgi:hypothetical protein